MFTSITNGSLLDHDHTSYTGIGTATEHGIKDNAMLQKPNMPSKKSNRHQIKQLKSKFLRKLNMVNENPQKYIQ